MSAITEKQLVAQVTAWQRKVKKTSAPCFAVRSEALYAGSDLLTAEGITYRVKRCRSDLEARSFLADLETTPGQGAVLVFSLHHDKLGADLLARFSFRRLMVLDAGATLLQMFNAKTLDPRIARDPDWIDALIGVASLGKAQSLPPAGVLDAEFAWSILLDDPDLPKLGFDLERLLEMSWQKERWDVIARLEPGVQRALFSWIGEREGNAAQLICHAVTEQGTDPELLLPIGLCLGPLMNEGNSMPESLRAMALTRLEPYLAGMSVEASAGRVWHRAAKRVAERLVESEKRKLARKVDDLLGALKSNEIAVDTSFSIKGIEKRLELFGESITSFLRRKELNGLEAMVSSFDTLRSHGLAGLPDFAERIAQARMAMRLAVWLKTQQEGGDFAAPLQTQIDAYVKDTSWADRATQALGAWEERSGLDKINRDLLQRVEKVRLVQQQRMADSLVDWNARGGDASNLRVEDILSELVAPLATAQPVLLLVFDGMSASVFSELMEDLLKRDWFPIAENRSPLAALAAIPSITAISRKALFSGKLDCNDPTTEPVAWRDHPQLCACGGKTKPQLFLKGDLDEAGGAGLSQKVRNALESKEARVVSVLLNVVDDQLSASDQLTVCWKVEHIRHLQVILDAASQAGRLLILASDHGNVIERNQTRMIGESKGGGDRYRMDDRLTDPEHERRISGPRIQSATGSPSVVVAATSLVRYHSKKTGYHGGCADMEMVIPLAVLACERDQMPEGWDAVDQAVPNWWNPEQLIQSEEPKITAQPKPAKTQRKREVENNLELALVDEVVAPGVSASWVDKLMLSQVLLEQIEHVGMRDAQIDLLRAFLMSMDRWRGNAALSALAKELDLPSIRLRGAVAQWKRLLNVDGYDIVSEETESERLLFNKDLAMKQFCVEV